MKKIKIFKDKNGNKLTFKEFIERWKVGIENITPLQSIKTQLGGTKITLLGMFLGLCVAIYGWRNLWWVGIILIGAILNTGVQFLGLRQNKKQLVTLEKQFAEPDEDNIPQDKTLVGNKKSSEKESNKSVLTGDNHSKDPSMIEGEPNSSNREVKDKTEEVSNQKDKVVILDDNELSVASYAEEFPENFEKISNSLDKDKEKNKDGN